MLFISGAQIVQKCRSHISTLGTRTVSSSQFRTNRPQILVATVQNLVAWAAWRPDLLHHSPWTFTSSGMWHGAPWLAFPDVPDSAAVHTDTEDGANTFLRNINPLNAELNPICHLLVILGAHHILHISRIKINKATNKQCVTSHKKGILDKTALVSTCLARCHSLCSFIQNFGCRRSKIFCAPPPSTLWPATFWSLCVLTHHFRTATISFTRQNSHLTDNTGYLARPITEIDPKRT